MKIALNLSIIKDLLIFIASFILIVCILQIRKLKKTLTLEIKKRLVPQVILDIDREAMGMYLKNESFSLARNIKIEDVKVVLDDYGFRLGITLKFEDIDFLKPNEKVQLKFKAFDKQGNFLPDLTEKIIPHLINASFRAKISLYNIENVKLCIILAKRQKKVSIEQIEFSP